MKRIICIFLIAFIIMPSVKVFADNDVEEELNAGEIEELVKTVVADTEKMPNINSRHAVIYDRSTRQSVVWEKRK